MHFSGHIFIALIFIVIFFIRQMIFFVWLLMNWCKINVLN